MGVPDRYYRTVAVFRRLTLAGDWPTCRPTVKSGKDWSIGFAKCITSVSAAGDAETARGGTLNGHARQAGGDSTLKLRRMGTAASVQNHLRRCTGGSAIDGQGGLCCVHRYQALRLKAHRCAAAGLDSGTAAERWASMPSTPSWIA